MSKRKKKDQAVPYDFIEEVNKMSKDEVIRRFIQEENDIIALDEQKKNDLNIKELSEQIKEMSEKSAEDQAEIEELKEKLKKLSQGSEEIEELKANKKALESGYKDEKKRRKALRDYLYNAMRTAVGV